MLGPAITVRTISAADVRGWQYHSRSDHHSKVACWGIVVDLLRDCTLMRKHAIQGKIAFGINHKIQDFKTNKKKYLDLVICTPGTRVRNTQYSLATLKDRYGINLTPAEESEFQSLPGLLEAPVGQLLMTLEAKACMTAHIKALPRLHSELNDSHQIVHGAADIAIAAGFVMINASEKFASPGRNPGGSSRHPADLKFNVHKPTDAGRAVDSVKHVPRRGHDREVGFDALGIVVVDGRNDGSPFRLVEREPAPPPGDSFHYEQMIRRLCQRYAQAHGTL